MSVALSVVWTDTGALAIEARIEVEEAVDDRSRLAVVSASAFWVRERLGVASGRREVDPFSRPCACWSSQTLDYQFFLHARAFCLCR